MKKQLHVILILGLVFILVLSACANQNEVPVEDTEVLPLVTQNESVEAQEDQQATIQEEIYPAEESSEAVDMEALILEKIIGSDHTLDFILRQDKTREEWEKTIDRMIGYGAKINEEEKQLIIDWLLSR